MTDDVLIRRAQDESAAADNSHGAEWGARTNTAPLNAMGANVTIQKNWQELIRPNKLQVSAGADAKREATVVAEPLERGFRSEEHTSELQSLRHLVCRLLLEKKKKNKHR